MEAEIITIGDEILIGQIVDTNSAWIADKLGLGGVSVKRINSISDQQEAIIEALNDAQSRADVVLMTGGLGPTKDDITKTVLAEYFESVLELNEEALENVKRIFARFGKTELLESNTQQAVLPSKARIFINKYGTASGMWFEKENTVFVSMPGVPYEMKHMMETQVLPALVAKFEMSAVVHRTVLTQGVGESYLAEIIQDWENGLKQKGVKLAYLPSPGMVRLRLSAMGENEAQVRSNVDDQVTALLKIIPKYVFGYDEHTLEQVVGQLLVERSGTVSTAESCTGGYLAHLITSIPGSSDYFEGSVLSYSNKVKMEQLGVSALDLDKHGAVSKEVVEQMAIGVKAELETNYALATSGIAGPDGGTEEKPVGTVWIAVASPQRVFSQKFLFGDNRERNIRKSALSALNMLRKEILGELET